MELRVIRAGDDILLHGDNPLSWVKINDHTTIGLARAVTPHEMMVKAIGARAWPTGDVDLLGHVF